MQPRLRVLLCLGIVCAGLAQAGMLTTDISGFEGAWSVRAVVVWQLPHGPVIFEGAALQALVGAGTLWLVDGSSGSRWRDDDDRDEDPEFAWMRLLLGPRWDNFDAVAAVVTAFGDTSNQVQVHTSQETRTPAKSSAVRAQDKFPVAVDSRETSAAGPTSPKTPGGGLPDQGGQAGGGVAPADVQAPEPSSLALIALGLGLLGARRLRRA